MSRAESGRGLQAEGGTERGRVEEGRRRLVCISHGGGRGGRGVQESEEEEKRQNAAMIDTLRTISLKGN